MKDKKYHSPFTRVSVTKNGGEKIQQLQHEFDRFWKKVNQVSDKCPEKFHAMKAMQEACMWLTRACALQNENTPKHVQTIDKAIEHVDKGFEIRHQQRREGKSVEQKVFSSLKDGQVIQKNPRIIVKRKKI